MSVAELQEYTRIAKYARFNKEKSRRETWAEQVNRVMDMHKEWLGDKFESVRQEWEFAREMLLKKRILGSQRALQFGGPAILQKPARLFNCSFSYCDRVDFFQGTMWLLLAGVGVGFSVQKHHIAKLPRIKKPEVNPEKDYVYQIPDTIEGWSDAIGVLLSSYFVSHQTFPDVAGKFITFDFSKIRPSGSPISNTNGKAPGPEPLRRAIANIRKLLDSKCDASPNSATYKLRPIDAYDVVMHSSDAVLSGGVRRSATICLFSPDDKEMISAKTGSWFTENPQRGRSNNSATLLRSAMTREGFAEIMKSVKEFGEPGFIFVNDLEHGVNPCAEISLYAKDQQGRSGFAFCNLSEINAVKCKTAEDFYDAARAASILGTFQATYTRMDYLGEVSESIMKQEALLGVSITGIQDNPDIALNPQVLQAGADIVKQTNSLVAEKLVINPAARCTTVKPSGSASALLGTSSGIHPQHAKKYIRRVQSNKNEAPLQFFELFNPKAVEESVWSANKTDRVISFLCEVPKNARTKRDVSALQLLGDVKLVYENWVTPGTREELNASPGLRHNVSNTITVRDDEWDAVEQYIFDNRDYFTGISLLSQSGDKDYPQAPFQAVHDGDELHKMYGNAAYFAAGLIVHALRAFNGNLYSACDTLLGRGEKLPTSFDAVAEKSSKEDTEKHLKELAEKWVWIKRARQFSTKYFDGDLKKMTHCLKDVNVLKTWEDLSMVYSPVPWEQFQEVSDATKVAETVACSGGACEVSHF